MNALLAVSMAFFAISISHAHQNSDAKLLTMSKKSSEIPDRRTFPLSTKVSACENFHDYVCSEAESSFELRPDRSSHTFSFSDSFERLLNKKKEFFSNIENEKKLSPRAMQIKNFYLACMNEQAGAKEEKQTVADRIAAISRIKSTKDFVKLDTENFFQGKANLMVFDSSANADNPDLYDAYMGVSFMNLPDHGYYEKPELVSDYKNLITEFFKIAYPKMSAEEIKVRVEKMYNLEAEFVQRYPKAEERRQRWGEKRDIPQKQFLKDYPNLKAEEIGRASCRERV